MPRYKRTRDEAELDISIVSEVAPENVDTLNQLRNMWEFASLMQYIFLFGEIVKIDNDLDIEDLEAECLTPTPSHKLAEIGLALLKFVSSHRGLTPEIFSEYTRRQYLAKAPHRNPFGDEEEPTQFNDLDVFTRVRVLQQLSTWTLGNADRIRGLMPEDEDNTNWRMEPLGWDKEDRSYFVLDDNRLYRRADDPIPPPAPKVKAKSKSTRKGRTRGTRASKRRKVMDSSEDETDQDDFVADDGAEEATATNGTGDEEEEEPGYGFSSKTWECIAITLDDYQEFMSTIFRTRDPNEKQLRSRLEEDVVPIIAKRAEALRQKQLRKMRELETLQKMSTAKRSSRLADKAEKEKQDREELEAEEKQKRDLKMALAEQERQKRIEEGHESRRATREQRLRERESKRILHEQELAKLEADAERAGAQDTNEAGPETGKRISNRNLQTQREQHRLELEKLAEEESKWIFDCAICGVHGENLDDGTHSIACDQCSVWQHSKCHGLTKQQAERDDFRFICASCKQKEEDAKQPKLPPLKIGKGASPQDSQDDTVSVANGRQNSGLAEHVQRQLDNIPSASYQDLRTAGPFGQLTEQHGVVKNGTSSPSPSYHPQAGTRYPPVGNFAPNAPRQSQQSPPRQTPQQDWPMTFKQAGGQHTGQASPPPIHHPHAWPQNAHPGLQQPYQHPAQAGSRPSSGYASPPIQPTNGHGAPTSQQHHQQHHQFAHQHAVASSGGHPSYYNQLDGVAPSQAVHPGLSPTQQQRLPIYNAASQQRQSAMQQSSAGQRMDGMQASKANNNGVPPSSPTKNSSRPYPSPQGKPAQPLAALQRSPQTSFPPPTTSSSSYTAHSPIKSSSPPHRPHQIIENHVSPHQNPPPFSTPQSATRTVYGSGNEQTGHDEANIPPNSSSKLAADGMSGPWPESSTAIPQKHDQSAAPPPLLRPSSSSSQHHLDRSTILGPVPTLAPSPRQGATSTTDTVGAKKLMEATNGMSGNDRS